MGAARRRRGDDGVMTDLTRLRAVLRGRARAAAGPAEPARAASVDIEALATGLGGGLEDAPLGPCPVVRWWLGDDFPYGDPAVRDESPASHRAPPWSVPRSASTWRDEEEDRLYVTEEQRRQAGRSTGTMQRDSHHGLLGRALRAISAEGLRVLCGDGGGGDAPWSGVDPTAGLIFFDLETTGLSGGAGTVAFVVGFGCFEGSRFHVWQFVLPSFAGERCQWQPKTAHFWGGRLGRSGHSPGDARRACWAGRRERSDRSPGQNAPRRCGAGGHVAPPSRCSSDTVLSQC